MARCRAPGEAGSRRGCGRAQAPAPGPQAAGRARQLRRRTRRHRRGRRRRRRGRGRRPRTRRSADGVDGGRACSASPGICSTRRSTTFPGMVLWGATTNGPLALPGHLSGAADRRRPGADAADHGEEASALHTSPTPTCSAQFELASQIRDKVNEANNAIIQIRRIKKRARRIASTSRNSADAKAIAEQLHEGAERGRGGRLPGAEPEQPGSAELPDQDQQPPRLAAARRQRRRGTADRQRRADLRGSAEGAEGGDRSPAARRSTTYLPRFNELAQRIGMEPISEK